MLFMWRGEKADSGGAATEQGGMGTSAAFADRRDMDVGDSLFLRTREVNPSCLVYYLNAATAPGQKAIPGQSDRLVFIRVIALSAVEVILKMYCATYTRGQSFGHGRGNCCSGFKLSKTCYVKQGTMQELLARRARLI